MGTSKLRTQIVSFAQGSAAEKELTDTPPLSFSANGQPLLDWNIVGANGGVGEKTANIFSSAWEQGSTSATTGANQVNNSMIRTADYIPIEYNATYSISRDKASGFINMRIYDSDNNFIGAGSEEIIEIIVGGTSANPMKANQNFCCFRIISESAAYIRINDNTNDLTTKYMMVADEYTSETMPSYEPYGYKIPVICGGETKTIYLDEPLGASDSISMTDTGISIPTVSGSNTLSVGTTVQPSSVYIKYKEGGDEMVTLAKIGGRYNTILLEIRGLSTDTKPTTEIEGMIVTNGSTYIEIDTGDTYMFDAENGVWHNITG